MRLSEFIFPFPVFAPSDKRQTKVSQHFCSASKLCIFCTLIRFIFKVLFLPIQLHPRELQVPCFHSLFLFALAHRLLRARLRRYDVTVSSLSIKANCKLSCFFFPDNSSSLTHYRQPFVVLVTSAMILHTHTLSIVYNNS